MTISHTFIYAQGNDEKRKVHHHTYAQKEYDIKSGNKAANFYGNLNYKNWLVELGSYYKKNDTFVGLGDKRTPNGGDIESRQTYVHVTGKFDGNIKVQVAVDDIEYEGTLADENNITITVNGWLTPIQRSELDYHDRIFSAIVEKVFKSEHNKLLVGGFYKYKYFAQDGRYSGAGFYTSDFSNSLDIYSLYLEENYDLDADTRLIASVKGDFFRYKKEVQDRNEYIFRLGAIKNIDAARFKLFYTKSYIPVPFWQLYNEGRTPINANPELKYPEIEVAAASASYKHRNLLSTLEFTAHQVKNLLLPIVTNQLPPRQLYINLDKKIRFYSLVVKERYEFDAKNRLLLKLYGGDNSEEYDNSPKYGATLRLFNSYKKFDLYSELIYRSSYTAAATLDPRDTHYVESSFDFTAALKYHYTKDLLLGVRAENIFNDSMKMYYGGGLQPIEVFDRKIWANLEYMF